HQVDGALRVRGTFHVNAQKAVVGSRPLGDGKHHSFTEFRGNIQAELRQFAGNVGMQALLRDAIENFQVRVTGLLGVGGGADIFAQVVEGGVHTRVIAGARHLKRLFQCFAGDKTVRHPARGSVGGDPVG